VHVHVDLDVIDPVDGVANEYAVPDGPDFRELLAALELIGRRVPVGSASLTSYNPNGDADHRARTSALTLLDSLALLTT
jgi:arginase